MRSIVTPQFRKMLAELPERIQSDAREGFERWKQDPTSVGWKSLNGMHANVYSVQIGLRYRAIGVVSKEHDTVVWMFAGSHETYNKYVEFRRHMTQKNWLATSWQRLEASMATTTLQQKRAARKKPSAGSTAAMPNRKRPAPT